MDDGKAVLIGPCMIGKTKRTTARIGIALKQNRLALAFVAAWVLLNAAAFHLVLGQDTGDALLSAACIQHGDGTWAHFYTGFTEVVVFGAVASFVVANVTRHYRPEATCAELARHARDHVLVVGYSHLGERVRELATAAGADVVVVEQDRALAQGLVRDEEPVVFGSMSDAAVLQASGAAHAAVVVVATDDLEEAAIACRVVRAKNPRCELVVRCADDDVGKALARAYGARAVSTTRIAATLIAGRAAKIGSRRAIIVGKNSLASRVSEALSSANVETTVVQGEAELMAAPLENTQLVVFAEDDLGKNLVYADRVRDVNATVEIIARVFHEDAAQILANAPFRCTLVSTSRLAAQTLVQAGLLKRVTDPDARSARAAAAMG